MLFRRELAFPTLAKYQPYVFGLAMSGVAVFLMGAGTLAGISGLIAIVGGGMYLLVTVWSVFLGKKIATPGFAHVRAKDGVAARPAAAAAGASAPAGAVLAGHGSAGMVAPGTFMLAIVFLVSFVLYYFINWKYLATVWPLTSTSSATSTRAWPARATVRSSPAP